MQNVKFGMKLNSVNMTWTLAENIVKYIFAFLLVDESTKNHFLTFNINAEFRNDVIGALKKCE